MKIFSDIKDFFTMLSFVDIVFFFAVLILMILVITLIYFIRINDELIEEEMDELDLEETREMQIVRELNRSLAEDTSSQIAFTDYEKDQEEKAIISYEELLNKGKSNYSINYEKEDFYDDLSVKKFNLENLVDVSDKVEAPKVDARVISFAKEEAFLKALKQLQKELN